jgi:hypothetical protein
MNIYQAISAIMTDVDAIGKTKRNNAQGFNFRGVDDVYNTLHPLLAKHGVFTLPEVLEDRTEERSTKNGANLIYRVLKIKYTFCCADGTSVAAVVIGEGMDSGDKASNKAMSIAHKYAFFQVFAIPTEELVDPDASTPPPSEPISRPMTRPKPEPVDQKTQWRNAISAKAKQVGCNSAADFHASVFSRWPDWCDEGQVDWQALDVLRYNAIMKHFENGAWNLDVPFEDDAP